MLIISQILGNKAYAFNMQGSSITGEYNHDAGYDGGLIDSNKNRPISNYNITYTDKNGNTQQTAYQGGYEVMIRDKSADYSTAWISPETKGGLGPDEKTYYNQHNGVEVNTWFATKKDTSGNEFLQINFTLTNTNTYVKTVDLGTSSDIQIGGGAYKDDNAYTKSTGIGFTTGNHLLDGVPDDMKMIYNVYSRGYPEWVTPATTTWVGNWTSRKDYMWTDNCLDTQGPAINNGVHGGYTGNEGFTDTAFAISWQDIVLQPHQSITKSYIISTGELKSEYTQTVQYYKDGELIDDWTKTTKKSYSDTFTFSKSEHLPIGYSIDTKATKEGCPMGDNYAVTGDTVSKVYYTPNTYQLNFEQDDVTTKGTERIDVTYDKALSKITTPKKQHTASFYDDTTLKTEVNDKIVENDTFLGYYANGNDERQTRYLPRTIDVESQGASDSNAQNGAFYYTMTLNSNGFSMHAGLKRPTASIGALSRNMHISFPTRGAAVKAGFDGPFQMHGYGCATLTVRMISKKTGMSTYKEYNITNSGYESIIINENSEYVIMYMNFDAGLWEDYLPYEINECNINITPITIVKDGKVLNEGYIYDSNGNPKIDTWPLAKNYTVNARFQSNEITLPKTVEKDGYTLVGWESPELCGDTYDYDSYDYEYCKDYYDEDVEEWFNNEYCTESTNYQYINGYINDNEMYFEYFDLDSMDSYEPGNKYTLSVDTPFIAKWRPNTYKVNLNIYLQKDGETSNDKDKYTFDKSWSCNSNLKYNEVWNVKVSDLGITSSKPAEFEFAGENNGWLEIIGSTDDKTLAGDEGWKTQLALQVNQSNPSDIAINVYLNHIRKNITVKHYIENLDDDNETLFKEITLEAPVTSVYKAPRLNEIEGIGSNNYLGLVIPNQQTIIVKNSENLIVYHYKRERYTINLVGQKPTNASTVIVNKDQNFTTLANKTQYIASGSKYTSTFKFGKIIDVPDASQCFSLAGYNSQGWIDNRSNSVKVGSISPLSTTNTYGYDQLFKDEKTVTLYTKYEPIEYNIQYLSGETNNTNNFITKYKFDNEYTISNGTTGRNYTIRFNSNDISLSETPTTQETIQGNLEFKDWKIGNKLYKSQEKFKNLTQKHGQTLTATAEYNSKQFDLSNYTVSMSHYTFDGWYTAPTGGAKVTSIDIQPSITAYDITLYAHWTPDSYTVTYKANGGNYSGNTADVKETAYYDTEYTTKVNYLQRVGYKFIGWNMSQTGVSNTNDGSWWASETKTDYVNKVGSIYYWKGPWNSHSGCPLSDVTLWAQWEAQDVDYVVYHYKMDLNGNYSNTPDETQNLKAKADSTITPSIKTYEGFTSPEVQTVHIKPDGTTVVKYYYDRNKYALDLNATINGKSYSNLKYYTPDNEQEFIAAKATVYINDKLVATDVTDFYQGPANNSSLFYGSKIKMIITPEVGHTVSAQSPFTVGTYTIKNNVATVELIMPASNVEVAPVLKSNTNTKYIVRHWKQNIFKTGTNEYSIGNQHDTTNYTLAETEILAGTSNYKVKPNVKSYTGFTSPAQQEVRVKPDGTLVVDYYYTRNKYKQQVYVSYETQTGTWTTESLEDRKEVYYEDTYTWIKQPSSDGCFEGTKLVYQVKEAKDNHIKIKRKRYKQILRIQYENAEGQLTDSKGNIGKYNEKVYTDSIWGSTITWEFKYEVGMPSVGENGITVGSSGRNGIGCYVPTTKTWTVNEKVKDSETNPTRTVVVKRNIYNTKIKLLWETEKSGEFESKPSPNDYALNSNDRYGKRLTWSSKATEVYRSASISHLVTGNYNENKVLNVFRQKYTFDLNGLLDGNYMSGLFNNYTSDKFAEANIKINGKEWVNGVTDINKGYNINKGWNSDGTDGFNYGSTFEVTITPVKNKDYIYDEGYINSYNFFTGKSDENITKGFESTGNKITGTIVGATTVIPSLRTTLDVVYYPNNSSGTASSNLSTGTAIKRHYIVSYNSKQHKNEYEAYNYIPNTEDSNYNWYYKYHVQRGFSQDSGAEVEQLGIDWKVTDEFIKQNSNKSPLNEYMVWKENKNPSISTSVIDDYYRKFYTGQTLTNEMLMYALDTADDFDGVTVKNNLYVKQIILRDTTNKKKDIVYNLPASDKNWRITIPYGYNLGVYQYETSDIGRVLIPADGIAYSKDTYKTTDRQTLQITYNYSISEDESPKLSNVEKRIYKDTTTIDNKQKLIDFIKDYQSVFDTEDNDDKLSNWWKAKEATDKLRKSITIGKVYEGETEKSLDDIVKNINNKEDKTISTKYTIEITATDQFGKSTTIKTDLYIIINKDDYNIIESNNLNLYKYIPLSNSIGSIADLDRFRKYNNISDEEYEQIKEGILKAGLSGDGNANKKVEEYEATINSSNSSVKIIEY